MRIAAAAVLRIEFHAKPETSETFLYNERALSRGCARFENIRELSEYLSIFSMSARFQAVRQEMRTADKTGWPEVLRPCEGTCA